MNKTCQEIKCNDYLTDGGEAAWCIQFACPAVVAVNKCPKVTGQHEKETTKNKRKRKGEQ